MKQEVITLNGAYSKERNYFWSGVLSLAWLKFRNQTIMQDIKIDSEDPKSLEIANNFNKSIIKKTDFSDADYYIGAGFGTKIVNQINK